MTARESNSKRQGGAAGGRERVQNQGGRGSERGNITGERVRARREGGTREAQRERERKRERERER